MSNWLIGLTTLIYAGIAFEQAVKANWAMCVVYAGYAFANIGLLMLAS